VTRLETVFQVIGERPDPPSKVDNRIPRSLETICLKCLEKEPARRYASAGALAEELKCWLSQSHSRCPTLVQSWHPYKKRVGIGSIAMLMVLAAGLGLKRHRDLVASQATPPRVDRRIELTIPDTGSYPLGTRYTAQGRAVITPQMDRSRIPTTVVRFDLNSDQHEDYLDRSFTRNAHIWEEERHGIRYWGPDDDRQPFEVVYRIPCGFPVHSAVLYASLTLAVADATGVLEVSSDPRKGWAEVTRGWTIFPSGGPVDISHLVRGASTIYVRARMKGRDDGQGRAMAQFLRTSTLPDGHITTRDRPKTPPAT
jgi:hypothetical protein